MKTFDHVHDPGGWGVGPGAGPVQGYATVPATSDAKAYLRLLLDHKVGLVLAALLGLGLAWLYLINTEREYETSALVEVVDRGGPLDDEPQQSGWNDPTIEEEAQRLRSRKVLSPVVDAAGLRIAAEPHTVPVLSELAERLPLLADWIETLDAARPYAWDDDTRIRVTELEVPPRLEDKSLTLVSLGAGDWRLERNGRTLVDRASVGERLRVDLSEDESIVIAVDRLRAREGVEFTLKARSLESTLRGLRGKLSTEVSDSKSRMITVKMRGEDPARIAELTNLIVQEFQTVKLGGQTVQAETRLDFYEQSLPGVEAELRAAESALSSFRRSNASYDEDEQTRGKLRQLETLESQRLDLRIERDELAERYTDIHPSTRRLDKEIGVLDRTIGQLAGSIRTRPDTQRDLTVLEQDVETKRTLYNDMSEELQRLRLALSGTVGSVEIYDPALAPRSPVSPNSTLAYLAGTLATVFAYLLWLTLRSALSTTITDQESLERASGLPVYMNIPKSAAQKRIASEPVIDPRRLLPGKSKEGEDVAAGRVLALANPEDYSVENLRGLRSMLEDVMAGAENNVLMVTSPLPSMGKSFVALNLAVLVAQAGRRVLLIDADYQRGQLHKQLGLAMGPGLPEVVRGRSELRETVRATSVANLYCIPRGFAGDAGGAQAPTDKEFATFMQVVAPRFDVAIIDTPPVLSVATAAALGRHAGSTIMVVKENEVKEPQLAEALKRLTFSGVRVSGCILNGSSVPTPRHYAYYRERLD